VVRRASSVAAVADDLLDGPWELPHGWRWERMNNAAPVNPSRNFTGLRDDDEVVFIPMAAVGEFGGRLDISNRRQVRAVKTGYTRMYTGDVVIAKITPCMENGKLAIVPQIPHGRAAGTTEFHVLQPQRVSARYLFYWLSQQLFRQDAERNMTGTAGQKRVPADWLREYPIPVPPLDMQHRIVAKIDELFAEIDEGERELAEARAGLDTYRKSLLNTAVTGELTAGWRREHKPGQFGEQLLRRITSSGGAWRNLQKIEQAPEVVLPPLPEPWAWASLSQLGDFGRGKSKHRPRNDPALYDGPYPFVQTGTVAASDGEILTYEQTYSARGLAQSKLWPAGTICITIAANIAKTGVLNFDACFPDSIVGLTCAEGVNPRYIELFIRTVREELDRWAPATAQKNINLETLHGLSVPLPPTEEQDEIVRLVHRETGLEDVENEAVIGATISTLRQSVLSAAFRGELL
jgi:type I restriction enzyme, S subunit